MPRYHLRRSRNDQMANGARSLQTPRHVTTLTTTSCQPAPVNTSLTCNRTTQAPLTVTRPPTTASSNRSQAATSRSNLKRCTKLGRGARRTSPSWARIADQQAVQVTCRFSTISKATNHSEREVPTEAAHNATLLMSKSNSLGLLHSSKSQLPFLTHPTKVSRVPFGRHTYFRIISIATNQMVQVTE